MAPENIMDKVRAILRKADADNNDNAAERDVAMRMASKLLLKHGLSMADVGEIDEHDQAGREFNQEGFLTTEGDEDSWRGSLLHRIARTYFTQAYFMSTGRRGHDRWVLVGRKDHIDATKAMFEFVWPQLQREFDVEVSKMSQQHRFARRYAEEAAARGGFELAGISDEDLAGIGRDRLDGILTVAEELGGGVDAAIDDIRELCAIESWHYAKKVRSKIMRLDIAPMDTDNLGVWRRSWFDGAVTKIGGRLRDLMKEEVADIGQAGTELVKDETADLKRAMEDMGLKLHSRMSNRQQDYAGRNAGNEAGGRADLSGHRKVANGARKELGA